MEVVEIDLTDEELKTVELYAARKEISVEEAFKQALFEQIRAAKPDTPPNSALAG